MQSRVAGSDREVAVVVLSRSATQGKAGSEATKKELREKLEQVFDGWTIERVHVLSL